MERSAVSHPLRLLRTSGLVVGARHGKNVTHGLYDHHVARLLDEAVHHAEHLRPGAPGNPIASTIPGEPRCRPCAREALSASVRGSTSHGAAFGAADTLLLAHQA